MRLAIIADLRVEHTRRWLKLLEECDNEILVLSTYPYPVQSKNNSIKIKILPGLFRPGDTFVKSSDKIDEKPTLKKRIISMLVKFEIDKILRPLWYHLGLLDIIWQSISARILLNQFNPDIVQAFRTNNEGYIAALAGHHPTLLFIWGQDIVYFAMRYRIHRWLARWTMKRMDGLLADCQRDIDLARELNYSESKPAKVLPGNGGVDLSVYSQGKLVKERPKLIVYPRGFSPYLRLDNLLYALKSLIEKPKFSSTHIIILMPPSLIERTNAKINSIGLSSLNVRVKPFLDQASWSKLLGDALIMVSPSISDGTPNSMLEAMACGAFPVMGRLSSIEEWIEDGHNGLLFDPDNTAEIEEVLGKALLNLEMCQSAQIVNRDIIIEKANVSTSLPQLFAFYKLVQARHLTLQQENWMEQN